MNRASSLLSLTETGQAPINTSNNLRILQPDDHECVQAMQEDLCDWFNRLYGTQLVADTFMAALDNGVLLCRLASLVHTHAQSYFAKQSSDTQQAARIKVGHSLVRLPPQPPACNEQARSGTFFARDNVSNFIQWCKQFGVPAYFLFETNDIVMRKNVKNVLLCLLVVARIASEFGVDVPDLIRLEQEIDSQEAAYAQCADLEEMEKLNAELLKQQEIQRQLIMDDQEHRRMLQAQQFAVRQQREKWLQEQQELMRVQQLEQESLRRIKLKNQRLVDMRTLDEVIREMISDCACDVPVLMKKIAPGKYQFGEDKTMIFVRVLRNHVMVRVGGGWDTLENFLWKRDPCRRHRPREELQQRAAEVLRRNRERFYCEDSEQPVAITSTPKRQMVHQTSAAGQGARPGDHGGQRPTSTVQSVPAMARRRVRPATALGAPLGGSLDVPDGPVPQRPASTMRPATRPNTPHENGTVQPRVVRQSTQPNDTPNAHIRRVPQQTRLLSRADSTPRLDATESEYRLATHAQPAISRGDAALQKHLLRLGRAQSITDLNSTATPAPQPSRIPTHATSPRVAQPRMRAASALGMRIHKPIEPSSSLITPVPEENPSDAQFRPIPPSPLSPAPSADSDKPAPPQIAPAPPAPPTTAVQTPKIQLPAPAPRRRTQSSVAPLNTPANPTANAQPDIVVANTANPLPTPTTTPPIPPSLPADEVTPGPTLSATVTSAPVRRNQPRPINGLTVIKKSSPNTQPAQPAPAFPQKLPPSTVSQRTPPAPTLPLRTMPVQTPSAHANAGECLPPNAPVSATPVTHDGLTRRQPVNAAQDAADRHLRNNAPDVTSHTTQPSPATTADSGTASDVSAVDFQAPADYANSKFTLVDEPQSLMAQNSSTAVDYHAPAPETAKTQVNGSIASTPVLAAARRSRIPVLQAKVHQPS